MALSSPEPATTVRSAVQARTRQHMLSVFTRNQKGERRLSPQRYKLALTAHIGVSGAWLGASMIKIVLAIAAATATSSAVSGGLLSAFSALTGTLIALSVLTALTGVVLALGTKWGLLQYYWILVKIALTLTVILSAAVLTDAFVAQVSDGLTQQAATGQTLLKVAGSSTLLLLSLCVFDMLLVASATAIAVYKPWGKTSRGQRASARTAAPNFREARQTSVPARPENRTEINKDRSV